MVGLAFKKQLRSISKKIKTKINRHRKSSNTVSIGVEFCPEGMAVVCARPSVDDGLFPYCAFHPQTNMAEQPALLKQLVIQNHWQRASCHVVLHPAQYQISMTEAPNVSEDKLHDAMRDRLHDLFNLKPDDLAYDTVLLPAETYRGRAPMVMAVAMQKRDMLKIVEDVSGADLILQSIETTEASMQNLALSDTTLKKPAALLRLRSTSSMLSIIENDKPAFTRVLEMGMDSIRRQKDDIEGTRRVLDALVLEVQRSLDFYESQRMERVAHIYLLPAKQEAPGIDAALIDGIGIPVSRFPFEMLLSRDMLLDNALAPREQAYCLTAAGAALHGVQL